VCDGDQEGPPGQQLVRAVELVEAGEGVGEDGAGELLGCTDVTEDDREPAVQRRRPRLVDGRNRGRIEVAGGSDIGTGGSHGGMMSWSVC
jgi:hypothetical protein